MEKIIEKFEWSREENDNFHFFPSSSRNGLRGMMTKLWKFCLHPINFVRDYEIIFVDMKDERDGKVWSRLLEEEKRDERVA